MLRASADPYLVLSFQNLFGLKEVKEKERDVKEENGDLTPAKYTNGHVSNGFVNGYSKNGLIKNGHWKPSNDEKLLDNRELKSTRLQSYEYNPFWHALFLFGSTLGNEIFYITFFPFLFWNIDEYVARKMVFLWALLMYCGQAAKDIIQWPRPPSPPVISVEKRYQWEYGMPSTHAMVGALIPFCLVYYSYDRYEVLYPPTSIRIKLCFCFGKGVA
jgi:sphingosine-1-phosphate phosphatase 1